MAQVRYYATGKRKEAIARVWLQQGSGKFTVNRKSLDDYFTRETAKMLVKQPLELTRNLDKFDISVNVKGGGISGQAGAIRHGISKVLLEVNIDNREILKRVGFLTRDARVKERKKYGRRKARARYQYSKR
jgi:small subunit ribosomal protein S9